MFDLIGKKINNIDSWRIWRLPDIQRGTECTLMICSCTPSSVCGPWKQLQMVSTSRSISLLPGVLLSGALPVMWPYAISFCTMHRMEKQSRFAIHWAVFGSLWGVMRRIHCTCVSQCLFWGLCALIWGSFEWLFYVCFAQLWVTKIQVHFCVSTSLIWADLIKTEGIFKGTLQQCRIALL